MDAPAAIRLASPEDARAIAEIHARSWRAAYRGLMPDSLLDALSVEEREQTWRAQLGSAGEARVWIASVAGRSVGFAATAPDREDDTRSIAELTIMYLLPEAWGRGHGRVLMQRAAQDLRDRGFHHLTLWVLEGNARARRFYERAGLRADGTTRIDHLDGTPLPHLRYRGSLALGEAAAK